MSVGRDGHTSTASYFYKFEALAIYQINSSVNTDVWHKSSPRIPDIIFH